MIRYRIILGIFFALVFLGGCNQRKSTISDEMYKGGYELEIIPHSDTLSLSTLYKSNFELFRFNGLELHSINDILRYDSLWVIQGKAVEGEIHLFDSLGQYKTTLLKKGNGPDEVINVWQMKLYENALFCLVNSGTELIKYSLSNMKIEWRFTLPTEILSAKDFELFSDNIILFLKSLTRHPDEKEYKLYTYDRNLKKIIARLIELDKTSSEYISFSQKGCLYRYQDSIRYYEVFNRGILQIDNSNLNHKGYISFLENTYMFPNDKLLGDYTFEKFINYCKSSDYIWAHCNLYEGAHYITSTFEYSDDFYLNVIDKRNKTSHSYKWISDNYLLNMVYPIEEALSRVGVSNDCHYYTLSFYDIERMLKEGNGKILSKKLQETYDSMDYNSNDLVICLYEK